MKRDVNNKMIAGVCAGIANHLNIDPTLVRLGFVGAFLLWGIGPIIYLIAWIVMQPEEPLDYLEDENANEANEE